MNSEQTTHQRTKLSEEERSELAQLAQHPGYQTLLRLMEMKCILQDNSLLKIDPADKERVLAEHRIMVAKWAFFSEVKDQVQFEADERLGRGHTDEGTEIDKILRP